jgi:hypothetical protein
LPPSANDYVITSADIAGKDVSQIKLFPDYAFNPAGRTQDLSVKFLGPNAKSAEELGKPGVVAITPTNKRQVITYSVTNEKDGLEALAFILVPAATANEAKDPPRIDPDLPQQYISMNATGTWDLKDIVVAPSGREVIITKQSTVRAVQGNGGSSYVDNNTVTLTPPKDYRGPAAILFEVTDGSSADDPKGNKATLRLPIIVGDPEFKDTPPSFTPPSVKIEPGEPVMIDLRNSTQHPNPAILRQVTYSGVTGGGSGLSQGLSGSELTLSVPRNAVKGETYALDVLVRWDRFEVPGTINVTVVASSKPLAVAVNDAIKAQRGGSTVNVSALANDSNPFQTTGEPLEIVDAHLESDAGSQSSAALVSHTTSTVSITPGPGYIGDVTLIYTVRDATQDADRNVNGRIVVTVRDVPNAPGAPSATAGDAAVSVNVTAPNTSNGEPVDGYELTYTGTHWNGAGSGQQTNTMSTCAPPGCTVSGLNNGWSYRFSTRAHNELGWSPWSSASNTAIPYGTPAKVSTPYVSNAGSYAPTTVTWSWSAVGETGGGTTYHWALNNGRTGTTTGTSAAVGGLGTGTYTMTVYATNAGGRQGATSDVSAPTSVPPPPPKITLSRGAFQGGTQNAYHYHIVVANFSGNVSVRCYDSGGAFSVTYTVANGFNGDLACYSGFAPYHVVGSGVSSNTVSGW